MDERQKQYYREMWKRNRSITLVMDGHAKGLITFFVGDDDNKYLQKDSWEIMDDNEVGTTCYIGQMITNGKNGNQKYSWQVLENLINFMREKFPNVKKIKWNRYKKGRIHTYIKEV